MHRRSQVGYAGMIDLCVPAFAQDIPHRLMACAITQADRGLPG